MAIAFDVRRNAQDLMGAFGQAAGQGAQQKIDSKGSADEAEPGEDSEAKMFCGSEFKIEREIVGRTESINEARDQRSVDNSYNNLGRDGAVRWG